MAFIQSETCNVDQRFGAASAVVRGSFVAASIMVGFCAPCLGQLSHSPWPTFNHDSQRTGRSPYLGPEEPTVLWRFQLDNFARSNIAIGEDGTIYLGDDGGIVYAVNPNGTERWRFQTEATYIRSSGPTLDVSGTIYVGSSVYPDQNGVGGYLYALNPDGTLKWRFATGSLGHIYGAPALRDDGTVCFGSRDGNLYALTPQGTLLWQFRANYVAATPAIGYDGNIYAANSLEPVLYCVNASGNELWRANLEAYTVGGSSIGDDGVIYTQTAQRGLVATNPDGTAKWDRRTGSGYAVPCIGRDGTVYTIANPDGLYAVSPEGEVLWTRNVASNLDSPIVDPEGTVYFANYAIRSDGTFKWILREGQFSHTRPAMDREGTVYVIGSDVLYAIGPGRGKPAPELTISGDCPGFMEAIVSSATPFGRVAFVRSSYDGCGRQTTIPPGAPCAGTVLPVGGAVLIRIVAADDQGTASIAGNVPAAACGHVCLVALDEATCDVSNTVEF